MRDSEENERVVFVTDHHGREHELAALDGWRVMEVIRDWGVDVAAECGGAVAELFGGLCDDVGNVVGGEELVWGGGGNCGCGAIGIQPISCRV